MRTICRPSGFIPCSGYFLICNCNHALCPVKTVFNLLCLPSLNFFFCHWLCDSVLHFLLVPTSLYLPLLFDLFNACALAVSILGGAMPPCEGDNDCYHECEEAKADGGHILQSDRNMRRYRREGAACLNSTITSRQRSSAG